MSIVSPPVPTLGDPNSSEDPDVRNSIIQLRDTVNALDNANWSGTGANGLAYSKLSTLSSGQLIVGNAGVPTATTLSGDATISNTGVITIVPKSDSIWVPLITATGSLSGLANGTYGLTNSTPISALSAYTGQLPLIWNLINVTDYDAGTKKAKFRVRFTIGIGSTSPGAVSLTVGLAKLAMIGGSINYSSQAEGVLSNTLSINSYISTASSGIDPSTLATGAYCMTVLITGGPVPANIGVSATLEYRIP